MIILRKKLCLYILIACLLCTNLNLTVQASDTRSNQYTQIDEIYSASSIENAVILYEQALARHQGTIQIILANDISYQDFWNALKALLEKHTRNYSNFNVDSLNIDISNHVATIYTSFYTSAEEERFLDMLYAQLHEQTVSMSDYEKIKYMHDFICQSITYDDATLNNLANERSAYDGLVEGRTVCCGYTLAFQRFMEQEGIPSYIMCGDSPEGPHAWNVVYLDNQWYHLDATWDDQNGKIDYSYFLIGLDKIPFPYYYEDMEFQLSPVSYKTPY